MKALALMILKLILIGSTSTAQEDNAIAEIKKFQQELNQEYANADTSPLEPADLKNFKGHDFFDINLKFLALRHLQCRRNDKRGF